MQAAQVSIEERLEAHPALKARIEALLDVVENSTQDVKKADEAEQKVIEELRQMGQQALQSWAEAQQQKQTAQLRHQQPKVRQHSKKNSTGTPAMDV
jgi:uncharacterized NAD(P)/FAD-binding protein YdhS